MSNEKIAFSAKMVDAWNRSRPLRQRWAQGAVNWGVRGVLILSVVVAISALSLAIVHISLLSNAPPPYLFDKISRGSLALVGANPADRTAYARDINLALNTVLVVVTLLLAIQPILTAIHHNRKTRLGQPVRDFRVFKTGVDDTRVMATYYRDADEITIFSGDFDWIKTNPGLREILQKKRGRIKLVSYRTEAEVREALGEFYSEFSFSFNCPVKINCSVVEYPGHKVFLYKSTLQEGDQPYNVICVVRGIGNSIYLLEALALLCRHTANH